MNTQAGQVAIFWRMQRISSRSELRKSFLLRHRNRSEIGQNVDFHVRSKCIWPLSCSGQASFAFNRKLQIRSPIFKRVYPSVYLDSVLFSSTLNKLHNFLIIGFVPDFSKTHFRISIIFRSQPSSVDLGLQIMWRAVYFLIQSHFLNTTYVCSGHGSRRNLADIRPAAAVGSALGRPGTGAGARLRTSAEAARSGIKVLILQPPLCKFCCLHFHESV